MKSLIAALSAGILVSLGLFWLMQVMLMGGTQSVSRSDSSHTVEFIRLKKDPPAQLEPKKAPEKKAEKTQEPPKPEKVQKIEKVQPVTKPQKIVEKVVPPAKPQEAPKKSAPAKLDGGGVPGPEARMPKLDIPVQGGNSPAPVVNASGSGDPTSNAPIGIGGGTGTGNGSSHKHGTADGHGDGEGSAKSGGPSSGVVAITKVQPKYPAQALSRRIEGKVSVEFTIDPEGDVSDAHVVNSEPEGIFDNAAIQAISHWKFKQKIVNGESVEQRAVQTLQFKLAN